MAQKFIPCKFHFCIQRTVHAKRNAKSLGFFLSGDLFSGQVFNNAACKDGLRVVEVLGIIESTMALIVAGIASAQQCTESKQ